MAANKKSNMGDKKTKGTGQASKQTGSNDGLTSKLQGGSKKGEGKA